MIGAIEEHGPEVDDGVASHGALLRDRPHALLHAREEALGHDSADDLRFELDPSAGVGRQLQPDVAELAAATGLLLVAPLDLGRATNGLAVRDARISRHDARAELSSQALTGDVDLVLALAPEQLLTGLGVALDTDGRVLLHEAGKRISELVQISLRRRLDGDR